MRFENGIYTQEGGLGAGSGGIESLRGTYTTNNGRLTINTTQVYGGVIGLQSRWYTKSELPANSFYASVLIESTTDYSISGITLTCNYAGIVSTYTRR